MIIKEFYMTRSDGINLYRTYSDKNHYILQNETGAIYSEAIDIEDAIYTYSETDRVIEQPETEQESEPELI